MATTVERGAKLGWPVWTASALAGIGVAFLEPVVGSAPSHRIAAVAVLLAAVSGVWWAGASRPRRILLGAAAVASVPAIIAPGLWFPYPVLAAALLVVAAIVAAYVKVAGLVLTGGAFAAAGLAVLVHGAKIVVAQPGRTAALWLGGGAALLGIGLSALDRKDDELREKVGAIGGAAGLLAGGVTALVVGIVTLVKGGDAAGVVGAMEIGCAVTAFVMALAAFSSESDELVDKLIGWNVGGSIGIGVGLIVVGFYEGLHGTPEAWLALVPGIGFSLAPLPLLDDMLM